jgi:hypothetical protein
VQAAQLIRVLVAYGRQHPEVLHQDPTFLVMNSLMTAFPCR